MSEGSLAGRLLVATPLTGDSMFRRSVVYLLAHSGEGAFGVILNRPTDEPADDIAPEWRSRVAAPGVAFLGGPVTQDSAVGLTEDGAIHLGDDPDHLAEAPDEIRVFVGSSGWSPGQLEEEIGSRAWWVVDREPGDALTSDPNTLWERVLRRQAGTTAWFANLPDDLRTG